jgi:hypothetical protein
MTSRERLRRCYFHEELDRPGVYVRTGYPGNDPTYDRLKAYLGRCSDLKGRFRPRGLVSPLPIEQCIESYSDDFQRFISTLHTPSGDLHASMLQGLKGQPGLQERYFINNRREAESYLSLPIPQIGCDVSDFFRADREIGDRGIVTNDFFDPAGTVVELFGSENFAMMSLTDRDVIHSILAREAAIILDKIKFLLAHRVGPFYGFAGEEYLVPPLHGPADFRDFVVRYDRPIIDLIHEAGGRVHVHCHDRISRIFDEFVAMGVDVLHPFEPPPMGDITAVDAKRRSGATMCLEGNLQIAHMYEHTPEQIHRETKELIRDCFADRRNLIVCPSASPYIFGAGEQCYPQFEAMVEAVLACGTGRRESHGRRLTALRHDQ